MASKTVFTAQAKLLQELGRNIRSRRKELGISATTTAEAAEISRITLYRIEKGEDSVAMGAYFSVALALGLQIVLNHPKDSGLKFLTQQKLPKKIRAGDYAQLRSLTWQIKKKQYLTPKEALNIYERNWRHIDYKSMTSKEKKFLELLLASFERKRPLV